MHGVWLISIPPLPALLHACRPMRSDFCLPQFSKWIHSTHPCGCLTVRTAQHVDDEDYNYTTASICPMSYLHGVLCMLWAPWMWKVQIYGPAWIEYCMRRGRGVRSPSRIPVRIQSHAKSDVCQRLRLYIAELCLIIQRKKIWRIWKHNNESGF